MPLARLVAVVTLVVWCAGQLCAQSQRNDNSGIAHSQVSVSNVSSNNPVADLFQLDPGLHALFMTRSGLDADTVRGSHVDQFAKIQDSPRICYSIRNYLVVRDSPRSDVTHRDGSTTCVPAERFRMYSTTDQER